MFQLDAAIGLGLVLIIIGGAIFVAVRLMLRAVPAVQFSAISTIDPSNPKLPLAASFPLQSTDAVLLVQPGGRVTSLNLRARQLFNLQEHEIPNLERLARRTRPADKFYALCAQETQVQFALDGRLIEGSSYCLETSASRQVLVSLHYPEIEPGPDGSRSNQAAGTLQTVAELIQSMSANLDFNATIQTVLENYEKIIPADLLEINLWDAEHKTLTCYRITGTPGTERQIEQLPGESEAISNHSEKLIRERAPLFIPEITINKNRQKSAISRLDSARSYIGIPLITGDDLLGTLELGGLAANNLHQSDFNLAQLLSHPAAVAIHNSLIYKAERQQMTELSSLAQFSQMFGVLRDPNELFDRLVKSIAPLVPVNILGFLIYNEDHHMLEGQAPFQGVPSQFMPLYHIPMPPNSAIETLFMKQEIIISENAVQDPRLADLDLNTLATAATLRDTILVPLTSGGRLLGYIQASNHTDGGSEFSQDEIRLLSGIANQAAPIIENSALVQQTRERAQRAEGLRRIASLASSAATLDEILKYSLQELVHLLGADVGLVFLINDEIGVLRPHLPSMYGVAAETTRSIPSVLVDDPQFHSSVTGRMRAFISRVISEEDDLLPVYIRLSEVLRIVSAIAVPLVVRDQGIGELWIGSTTISFFDNNDLQVVVTAGGQLAGVVEQSYLVAQTDEGLRRKVDQLTALTRISRELSTTLDFNNLLQIIYDEALHTSRADCGTIWLYDLKSANPGTMLYKGEPPSPRRSALETAAIEQLATINVDNFNESSYEPSHIGIHSALLIPIQYQQKAAGLIYLHAYAPSRFDQTAVDITQALAAQVALIIGNAIHYQDQIVQGKQLHQQVEVLAKLLETSQTLRGDQPLEESLAIIAAGIRHATPFDLVLISVYQPETGELTRTAQAGLPETAWDELRARSQAWQGIQPLLLPEYQMGQAYFIPSERKPQIPDSVHTITLLPGPVGTQADAWNPQDSLLLPLTDQNGYPLGLISLDGPRDQLRPTPAAIETIEIFAGQAALSIENHQRLAKLEAQTTSLRNQVEASTQTLENTQSALPALLRKDLDQSIAIQRFSRQVRRIRDGLEITEAANSQSDPVSVLKTVGNELLTRLELDIVLEAENTPNGPRLVGMAGDIPGGVSPDALIGQRNPLSQTLADGELRLVDDLSQTPDWMNNPLLIAFDCQSFICLPIEVDQDVVAAVLVIGKNNLPPFTDEDRQIYQQLDHQIAIIIQNLTLLTETRRRLQEMDLILEFSRQLGSLDTSNILNALIKSTMRAIPSTHAGLVALWDVKTNRLIPQIAEGYVDNASLLEIVYPLQAAGAALALPAQVFKLSRAKRIDEANFARDYNLPVDDLMRYRKATAGKLPVSSLLVPIQAGETVLGVLVLDNFSVPSAFTIESEALATSFTQQTALALENARLFQASEERTVQLQALTMVAGTMTSSLQRSDLVASLLEQLQLVLPYDTATLWLREGSELTVAAANGFLDSDQRLGLSVAVEDSLLLNEMIKTGLPISVRDIRTDPRFPALVIMERNSWLGIPLIAKGEVIGVIALEKTETNFYSQEHIQAATTFAGQAAVALENSRLYEESLHRATELDQRSQRLALLNRLSSELGSTLDTYKILQMSANELQMALNCSMVSVVLFDDLKEPYLQVETPSITPELPLFLPSTPLFDHLRESLGIFSTNDVLSEPELADLKAFFADRRTRSLLAVPLINGSDLRGLLLLQTEQTYRFSLPEIELALTISNQTAIAIQNAYLYAETRQLTEELEERVRERTEELSKASHNTETLLQVITELTASLDMDQVLNRTLGVLDQAVGASDSAIYMTRQGNLKLFFRSGVEAAGPGLDLANPQALKIIDPATTRVNDQKWSDSAAEVEITGMVYRLHRSILVSDLQHDPRWQFSKDQPLPFASVLAVPLVLGEEDLGVLLLCSHEIGVFETSQISLVEAAARQISVALNNAELFNLIRDQAEHLGSMLREQQVEASRSRAILEAVADGVLVTDAGNIITLFNPSAERILSLLSSQVIGQSLDQFSGLFGKTGRTWFRTIRTWSKDPQTYHPGESYTNQIYLENGQIVAIHLAPVFLRSQFLGTVSIFRDITHEVMVDRLKSDFVANVSHELRTPMTSIKGYVEVMLMGASGELNEQQEHFLDIVKNNVQRLNALVNDLLDVSRIEAGRITLTYQPINIYEVAQEVVNDITRRSQEDNKPMNFTIEGDPDLAEIEGDLERIRQILGNLVSNSYSYTPENGKIQIRIHNGDNAIQVDVEDNGIGIPPAEHERIFERFSRGEDPLVLATAGTGLGLSIVKTLVEMHHGTIWLSSSGEPGKGAIFSFTLPLHQGGD